MRTVVLGERSPELEVLIARRRALGQDLHDEVWDGEYHMGPAPHQWHSYLQAQAGSLLERFGGPIGLRVLGPFNLGDGKDFRVPDAGLVRSLVDSVWVPTAAMVVEVVSPDDESWLKFDHYGAHGVDEVLVADPATETLHLFVLTDGSYAPADMSVLLGVTVADLHDAVDWPGSD